MSDEFFWSGPDRHLPTGIYKVFYPNSKNAQSIQRVHSKLVLILNLIIQNLFWRTDFLWMIMYQEWKDKFGDFWANTDTFYQVKSYLPAWAWNSSRYLNIPFWFTDVWPEMEKAKSRHDMTTAGVREQSCIEFLTPEVTKWSMDHSSIHSSLQAEYKHRSFHGTSNS